MATETDNVTRQRGGILVVSGPSGSGKTSVVTELLRDQRFTYSISATTRAPRGTEVHGRDYLFISEPEFRAWIGEGKFLEWAEVYGRLYGTPRAPLDLLLDAGRHVVLNIDVQGAARLREAKVAAAYVFLQPPSLDVLERRLRGRRTDDESTIARRLAVAKVELSEAPKYDRVFVNDDLARCAGEVRDFALARFASFDSAARLARCGQDERGSFDSARFARSAQDERGETP